MPPFSCYSLMYFDCCFSFGVAHVSCTYFCGRSLSFSMSQLVHASEPFNIHSATKINTIELGIIDITEGKHFVVNTHTSDKTGLHAYGVVCLLTEHGICYEVHHVLQANDTIGGILAKECEERANQTDYFFVLHTADLCDPEKVKMQGAIVSNYTWRDYYGPFASIAYGLAQREQAPAANTVSEGYHER